MARFASPATMTVPVDSPPESSSGAASATSSSVVEAGCVMARGCPEPPRRNRTSSPHADEVHHEDQGRARLDDTAGAALAVGLVGGDGQPAPAADLHSGDAFVPALDDHADTQPELQRVAAVPGRVELLAAVVRDADVVGADQAAWRRLGAVTDGDVLDHEVVGGRPGGWLDVRSGQLGHGSPSRTGTIPASSSHPSSACSGSLDAASSGWAISSAGRRAATIATAASTGGRRPARRNVVVRPIAPPTVPASAIDSGMKLSETKKSRLATRPSRAGGTRRCSSVPQMTVPASNVAPMTAPAAIRTQSSLVNPKTTIGTQPRPHSRFITVR